MKRMKITSILLALSLLLSDLSSVINIWSEGIQDYRTIVYEDDAKKPILKPTAQFSLIYSSTVYNSPIGKDLNSNAMVLYVTVGDTVSIQDLSHSNRGKSLKAWDFQFTRPDGDNQFISTKAFEKSYSLDVPGTYTFSLCVRDTVEDEAWTFYWGNWSDNGNHRVIGNNPGKNLSDPSDDFDGYWYFTRIVVIAREKSYTLQEKHIDTTTGAVLSETQHEGITENTFSTSADAFTSYTFAGSRAGYTWSEIANGKTENISTHTANFDSSHINAFHYYYYAKVAPPPPPPAGKANIAVYYKDKVSGEAVYPADVTTYKGVSYGTYTISAKPDTEKHKLDASTSPSPQIVTVNASNNFKEVVFYYIPEEPAQPPPGNLNPCAVIKGPFTEMAGEEIRWNGGSSYDYDGEIVSYKWTFAGAALVRNDSSRITVYYPNTGEYEVELEVTDDKGAKGYCTEDIVITAPYPTADIEISGVFKENRKVHIDGTGSDSPKYYPINKYTWTFSDAANIKYQGTIGSTTKEFDAIFKTAKNYTANLRVDNTYGLSNSTSKAVTIVADQNPKANFTVITKLQRNPADANQALITISNLTTSPDSDPIKKTVVFYTYDSDNDGNFDEEAWKYSTNGTTWQNVGLPYSQIKTNFDIYNIAGGNPLNFTIKTNQVGKYKFEAMAIEDIRTAETIPALLTPSDYRRGDTFTSKPNAEKIVDIINTAPTVSFEIFKEKQTDILILTDYTGQKLSNLQAALNAQKATLLANNVDVKFTIVNTAKQVAYINDKSVWYRRYGHVSFIGDYSSWADRESNRHFGVPVLWEQTQKLESQYDTLPIRNPQNVTWSKSGEWDGSSGSVSSKFITFVINCTNDVKSSGSTNFRTYYNHDGNTQTITNIENISASVDSVFNKEEVVQSVTTNVNSINYNAINTVSLREDSDRYALFITDNYQKDFTKAFGSFFPFGGLSGVQLDYFKNNGFKSYIITPTKAVDATILQEKITDFTMTDNYTYITTMDGTIKRLGTLNDVNNKDLLYPTEVNINSIKQWLGDYYLQNDGVLKYYTGGSSYATVSGVTGVTKLLSSNYVLTADGSLYYVAGGIATDTGLDGIENIFIFNNFGLVNEVNCAVAVRKSGGTYILEEGVLKKTISTTAKALWASPSFISLGSTGNGIRGYYLTVLLSNGYFLAFYEGTYAQKYIYLYNSTSEAYSLINNMKERIDAANFWFKDGYIYSIVGNLKYNSTVGKYYLFYNSKLYYGLEDLPDGVIKTIDGATMYDDGKVISKCWGSIRVSDGGGDYHYDPVITSGVIPEFFGKELTKVVANNNCVAVLLSNGDVYTQNPPPSRYSPGVEPFTKKYSNIKDIYTTQYDNYNNLYLWDNDNKLFTPGYSGSEVYNVKRVQSYDGRLLALTEDYKLYGMGETGYGQLGIVQRDTYYITGYILQFRNIYNVMSNMLQPDLSYITLREILDSNYANKYFGSGQYQAAINDITNAYLNDVSYTSNYILVNDTVDYRLSYADYESDSKYAESWINNHEPNYFENSMGLAAFHGKALTAPITRFDRKGRFTINVKARDNPKNDAKFDNYRLWSTGNQNVLLYVHEKPVALARVTIADNGNGTYTVKAFDAGSYDRDHTSRADKGIAAREWRWKEAISISWTNGQMNKADCTADKEYTVQLRVKDLEGVWSDYNTIEIDKDNPPVAVFNIDDIVIETADTLKVKDQSYPQSFSSITNWHWVVKKLNADGSVPAANLQNAQFTNSNTGTGAMAGYDVNVKTNYSSNGVGKYRIYLRVKNSDGLWSDGGTESTTPADLSKYYSVDFEVDKPPTASFTIANTTIKLDERLKLKDTSTFTGISPLAKWHWVVKKLNANGSVPSGNIQSAQFVDRNTGTSVMAGYDVNVTTYYNDLGAGKYRIYLRVMNGNGMWSDGGTDSTLNLVSCVYRDLTVDRPPTASFAIAKNPIALAEKLKIKDTSSTAGFSPINRWHWIVKKYNANGTLPAASLQSLQFPNSNAGTGVMAGYDVNVNTDYNSPGVGKYRIYLRVRNSSGMWSDGGTDSAYDLGKCFYQDLMVQESFKLSNFVVTRIRDVQLESYYYNAIEGQYIQRTINVNDMAIDRSNFGPEIKELTKGYIFEFKIDSKSFNDETDYIEITPHFYTCTDSARDPEECDLFWENSYHEILRVGEGAHSKWAAIKLEKSDRTVTTGNDAIWRGLYFIPGTAWAVPDGTSAADSRKKRMDRDIIVNFEIKGYKNGVLKYDYNLRQWPIERTSIKHPYEIGDVIRYSHSRSNLDDNNVIINRP